MPIEVFAFLCIPAKTGYPIELDLLLEEFINIRYGPEAVATCKPDITILHTLRNDILSHFSDDTKQTIRRIKQYLNLLMCLENRIPINDHGMLVNFTWSNCFLSHRTSIFERCCMLFCLAVAYNEYGGLQPLEDSSSLAKAAKCYQKSASIFEHLRKECPPAYGCAGVWDLTSECLDAFAKILLAQAVEIQVMKASLEKADPQKIFELASHASHLYSVASAAVSEAPAKCRFPKAWSEHLEMKITVTKIQAEHYASVMAVQGGNYEEQLARKFRVYKLILSVSTSAYKERFHAAAKNEICEIEAIKKEHQVNMDTVTAMEASLTLKEITDAPQFDQIQFVFSEKHQKSSAFRYLQAMPRLELLPEEAYEPVITSEIDKLRGLTHICNHILTSFNLPASQLAEDELVLELSKAASNVRKSDGVKGLQDSMRRLASLSTECIVICNDISRLIQEEKETESEFVEEFGCPPADGSTEAEGLRWRTLLSRCSSTLQQANHTDQFLRDVLGANLSNFERLSLPKSEFENLIMKLVKKMHSQESTRDPTLTQVYGDISRLKLERRNFELDFQKTFSEKMVELLQSNGNTRKFASQQIDRLIIFVRKCTDSQKVLLNMLENMPAIVHRKEDKEESQISELLFAAETYEQLQSDIKQGTGYYEMMLRILKYFSMILRKIEEDKEQRAEDAAISAFINLIDELRVDTQDNSQTDDQVAKSADNTGGSIPENDAEQSSFKGFKRRRSALSSVEEQVIFPVKNEGAYSGGKTPFQEFIDGLKLVSLDSTDELQAVIMSLIPQIMSSYGLLCFLYSILLTHGLEDVKKGMAGEAETLIDSTFGSASQCLLNLLITGRSSPHLFDGERTLSGFTMQGVIAQPKTGFLTVVEALRYCEVGWYLKNPSTPVWILGSETHFTVLASDNRDLVSVEEPLPAPGDPLSTSGRPRANLRQAEREFTTLTENADSGFLSYEQFEVLLGRLGLPVDQQSISTAKSVIDSEGLGIILREPFLAYYYAEELQRESSPVSSFRLVHYNGLAASNSNGRIRYRYGEANLLDPVDDTNPTGGTPLDRCLKTKWPTIRVMWSNEPAPSLN